MLRAPPACSVPHTPSLGEAVREEAQGSKSAFQQDGSLPRYTAMPCRVGVPIPPNARSLLSILRLYYPEIHTNPWKLDTGDGESGRGGADPNSLACERGTPMKHR